MQPCGGCVQGYYSARRLLGGHGFAARAPTPVAAPGTSVDAQRAHVERVLGVTTTLLFVASVSYIALSTLYGCLQAGTRREPGGDGDSGGAAPAAASACEETKRALQEIPVQVVVVVGARDGGGDREGGEVEEEGEEAECAVCLAEYAAGDEVRVLPACRHGFHRECVDRWLLARAPTCPVCRAPVARVEGGDDKEDCTGGQGDVGESVGRSRIGGAGSPVLPEVSP